ncbi:hypothetical protein ABVK25_006609 [Lepraria finkii]|uniref:Uncharacterized protein n=1 Tax=Lepraria finkii TaxID=1340010 RepID=A0ABR4B532_9LECA
MASTEQDAPLYNLSGALIFTAYAASALFLTGFIVSSLIRTYERTRRKKDDGLHRNLQIFSALPVLSFSTLLHHMLSRLIVLY